MEKDPEHRARIQKVLLQGTVENTKFGPLSKWAFQKLNGELSPPAYSDGDIYSEFFYLVEHGEIRHEQDLTVQANKPHAHQMSLIEAGFKLPEKASIYEDFEDIIDTSQQ